MLSTNLLPFQEKKALQYEDARRIILLFAVSLVGILLIGIILLFPSYISHMLERRELEYRLAVVDEAVNKLEVQRTLTRVASTKSALTMIQNFALISGRLPAFLHFFAAEKSGIRITTISAHRDATVTITGSANTRSNLLDFEKSLRDANMFQELHSPISNILREVNINFTFEGTLREHYRF